jgi:hypothetical protein
MTGAKERQVLEERIEASYFVAAALTFLFFSLFFRRSAMRLRGDSRQ